MGMSRLELAQKRLTQALESLEKAVELSAKRGKDVSAAEARIAALTGERERLQARIAQLEDELAALSSITQDVEDRLDGAIGDVEHQHIGGTGKQARQQQAIAFATGKRFHRRPRALRRKQEVFEVADDGLALIADL